jgi:hypothetical protein
MPNSRTCPKCRATDILRIPIVRGRGGWNWIPLGPWGAWTAVGITRYLCGTCGYIEEWVDSAEDIAKVKKVYST